MRGQATEPLITSRDRFFAASRVLPPIYSALGRPDEALAAAQEAMAIWRELARLPGPVATRPGLLASGSRSRP
jgi:hypothetical protein